MKDWYSRKYPIEDISSEEFTIGEMEYNRVVRCMDGHNSIVWFKKVYNKREGRKDFTLVKFSDRLTLEKMYQRNKSIDSILNE